MKKVLFKSLAYTLIVRCILFFSALYFELSLTDFFTELIIFPFEICVLSMLYFFIKGRTDKSWSYIISTVVFNAVWGLVFWIMILGDSIRISDDLYISLEMSMSVLLATVLTIDAGRTACKPLEKSQKNIPEQTRKPYHFLKKAVLNCCIYALLIRLVPFGLLSGAEYFEDWDFIQFETFLFVIVYTFVSVFFAALYFGLKGKTNHQWGYISVMVIIQIVFCLITLMVSNYVNEEYPRSSIVLLMGISEYFANSIFAAVLVIEAISKILEL